MDQTGLAASMISSSLEQRRAERADPANADAAPSLFTALTETLGLRLQRQKVPEEVVVVEHVERAPLEN
jgi:uncharacterized protein (TIGR03435 family)